MTHNNECSITCLYVHCYIQSKNISPNHNIYVDTIMTRAFFLAILLLTTPNAIFQISIAHKQTRNTYEYAYQTYCFVQYTSISTLCGRKKYPVCQCVFSMLSLTVCICCRNGTLRYGKQEGTRNWWRSAYYGGFLMPPSTIYTRTHAWPQICTLCCDSVLRLSNTIHNIEIFLTIGGFYRLIPCQRMCQSITIVYIHAHALDKPSFEISQRAKVAF